MAGAVVNLANATIGAGVLVLPHCMRTLGIGLGTGMLVASAFVSAAGCWMLHEASGFRGTATMSYGAIAATIGGTWAGTVVELAQAAYSAGSCIGYMVIVGDELSALVDAPRYRKAGWGVVKGGVASRLRRWTLF